MTDPSHDDLEIVRELIDELDHNTFELEQMLEQFVRNGNKIPAGLERLVNALRRIDFGTDC